MTDMVALIAEVATPEQLREALLIVRQQRDALRDALINACESIAVYGEQPPQSWLDAIDIRTEPRPTAQTK